MQADSPLLSASSVFSSRQAQYEPWQGKGPVVINKNLIKELLHQLAEEGTRERSVMESIYDFGIHFAISDFIRDHPFTCVICDPGTES
jgi:hypothetical protein